MGGHQAAKDLRATPLLRQILRNGPLLTARAHVARQPPRLKWNNPQHKALIGNVDLAVLRVENQNPTHVTPFIASLSFGLVRERFRVIGPPETRPNEDVIKQQEAEAHVRLGNFVLKANRPRKKIINRPDQRLKPRSCWYQTIQVDDETYSVRVHTYLYQTFFMHNANPGRRRCDCANWRRA